MFQKTLNKSIACSGIGLHGGKEVSLVLRPAPENTGVVFCIQTKSQNVKLATSPDLVSATGLATTIGSSSGKVSTVEHLLAALRGLEIDNVYIDVDAPEVPIMDGSSSIFVKLIQEAGIVEQKAKRFIAKITKRIEVREGDKYIIAEPYNGFLVDYSINFPHPSIGKQRKHILITPKSFSEIASSRTFGFLKDVEALRANGLALGGSLDNAIVLDDNGVMNKEGLRFVDEFVRHKILDFVGDMAIYSKPLRGKFTVNCSGHKLNNMMARYLAENAADCLKIVVDSSELSKNHTVNSGSGYRYSPAPAV